jgi:uncharacterized membrane protein
MLFSVKKWFFEKDGLELHSCIAWESFLAQNLPTNSAEETNLETFLTRFVALF